MKLNFFAIILILTAMLFSCASGGTVSPFTSAQLAPGAVSGYALYTDGRENYWDEAAGAAIPTLDQVYDAGNLIDYTGASTSADAVILSAGSGEDPDYFIRMLMDGNPYITFSTATATVWTAGNLTADQFLSIGTSGVINEGGGANDFRVETDGFTNGLLSSGLNNTVTFGVPSTIVGDVDTAGTLYIADGSGNYVGLHIPAIGADWNWAFPTDDGNANEVLITDGSGNTDWVANAAGAPGGLDTYVQYNDGGVFAGEATFNYVEGTDTLNIPTIAATTLGCTTGNIATVNGTTVNGVTTVGASSLEAGTNAAAGSLKIYDGSNNYLSFDIGPITQNWTAHWPTTHGDGTKFLGEPDGDGYLAWGTPIDANAFQTIACSSGTNPVADTTYDTLTLTAGTGITITGASASDTVTIANTVADTDTDNEVYDLSASALTLSTSYQQFGLYQPVLQTGTGVRVGVTLTWTVAAGTDTVTVALYIDGSIQGTWTTTAGAAGSYSSTLTGGSNGVTVSTASVSHSIGVWVKKTSNGTTDTITVTAANVLVNIK
jgi:hypothetical protein